MIQLHVKRGRGLGAITGELSKTCITRRRKFRVQEDELFSVPVVTRLKDSETRTYKRTP